MARKELVRPCGVRPARHVGVVLILWRSKDRMSREVGKIDRLPLPMTWIGLRYTLHANVRVTTSSRSYKKLGLPMWKKARLARLRSKPDALRDRTTGSP